MRAVKSRNTNPELAVRQLLFSTGYRYRLHRPDLPGKPDIAFPGRRKVIFVNGCFWHGHDCARGARVPKANRFYWEQKVSRNRERDKLQLRELRELGWSALSVWECEIRNPVVLLERMKHFLDARSTEQPS
jgi:DNA mismatch endonuclease (patch repair protein)